jgi:hypothetical protein
MSEAENFNSKHRFANMESLQEIHRVLKPGAGFGLIWNLEDCKSNHALLSSYG